MPIWSYGKKSDLPEQILPSDPQALMDLEIKVSVSQTTQPPRKLIFQKKNDVCGQKSVFWSLELAHTKVLPKIVVVQKWKKH